MYNKTVVIIICAGKARRWSNYLNTPKHFVTIDGQRILDRTVRLLKQYDCDVKVVANTKDYEIEGSELYIPKLSPEFGDADKFLSSRKLWNDNGRTVILYGDVYFTEEAIQTIMDYPHPEWRLFGRFGESSFTGSNHGECFGISFFHDYIAEFEAALRRVVGLLQSGVIDRNGGWETYKAMIKMPDNVFFYHDEPLVGRRFTQIDDWTEDFDWESDYTTFLQKRKEFGL